MRVTPHPPRPRHTLGEIADEFGLREVTGHPTWRDIVVTGVRQDNRAVVGGSIFVALPGGHVHGARFASDALARGAVAVLTDDAGTEQHQELVVDAPPCLGPDAPFLVVDDNAAGRSTTDDAARDGGLPAILGRLASAVLDDPSAHLTSFGVTGTNGKTTVAYMVEHVLAALGRTTGLVGTVEVRVAGRSVPATLTTPQAVDLQHMLADMVDAGVSDLAMEVSSHALALGRVDGIEFDVAGFTNLTQDHLDFHPDFEDYFAAKASLFAPERSGRAVVTIDDEWGLRLYRETAEARGDAVVPLSVAPLSGGEPDDTGPAPEARERGWIVTDAEPDGTGTAFTLRHADGRAVRSRTALPGGFNVANAALALAMVLESVPGDAGFAEKLEAAVARAGGVSPVVPGRMEVVAPDGPRVIVDFAHNSGALESALATLRATTRGRLLVAFGAAGERDRGKRPEMGRIAAVGADDVVVTDDDPHDEDPAAIRAAVLAGARAAIDDGTALAGRVREIAPREDAIATIVAEAGPDDTVLLAGRGHETSQDFAGTAHPLDDREAARAALAARTPRRSTTP